MGRYVVLGSYYVWCKVMGIERERRGWIKDVEEDRVWGIGEGFEIRRFWFYYLLNVWF